jgi:hypothetical protein
MPTECSQDSLDFGTVAGRQVVASFDGASIARPSSAVVAYAVGGTVRGAVTS